MYLWPLVCFCLLAVSYCDGAVAGACQQRTALSVTCRKPCQTEQDCVTRKNRRRSCLCDGDCGLSCARLTQQCTEKPPEQPRNGRRELNSRPVTDSTSFSVNDVIRYSCNPGYTLTGPSELRCSAIGKFKPWDNGSPTCRRSCPHPGVPNNGRRSGDSFEPGETIIFRCNPGYNLVGDRTLQCRRNLRWDGKKPECKVAGCGSPTVLDNARIDKGYRSEYIYGDRILYICNSGYYRSGSGMTVCGQSGWVDAAFKCLPKSCGNPGSPKNGRRQGNNFKLNQVVTYSCDLGYELDRSAFRRCQPDQTWDGTLPTCKRVDCGEPDPLTTGSYFGGSTLYGEKYSITCNKGYSPNGPSEITCGSDAMWSARTVCQVSCAVPRSLGMESGAIKDFQLSARSVYNRDHFAKAARLFKRHAWCANHNQRNKGQFIRVDFEGPKFVLRFATQGNPLRDNWVTEYTVEVSRDGSHFEAYKSGGQVKVFLANSDRNAVVTNSFDVAVLLHAIKIIPTAWHGDELCLRFELYGCDVQQPQIDPGCSTVTRPAGLASDALADTSITASSQWDANHAGYYGRVNGNRAWCSDQKLKNAFQFLQVDLGSKRGVVAIATQGQSTWDNWSTSYKLKFSDDDSFWQTYTENNVNKVFPGNSDRNSIVKHNFPSPLRARYIQIVPHTFHGNDACLRVEIFTCTT